MRGEALLGGTQVLQTLLWMEHKRQTGEDPGVTVEAAVTFSGWMDMTGSGPTYETRRWVDGAGVYVCVCVRACVCVTRV